MPSLRAEPLQGARARKSLGKSRGERGMDMPGEGPHIGQSPGKA